MTVRHAQTKALRVTPFRPMRNTVAWQRSYPTTKGAIAFQESHLCQIASNYLRQIICKVTISEVSELVHFVYLI